MYKRFVKRCLDFVLSLIALIILSPVLLIVALLVRCKLGSPIIFQQQRLGLHEKIFCMYKFRKGDMAIVGPRPLLVQYLSRYNERQHHRHDVRPGFTGLAQVNGRNSISWQEKFEWDVKYAEQVSFWMDVKIIAKTVGVVLKRDGISSETSVTMEEFRGNE